MSVDFDRGSKTTGSKFYFLTGEDALMEWNLINYMLKFHLNKGYKFVIPPYLVNNKVGEIAGLLPRFEGDYYKTQENLMLIPTAETPLVGMHCDEIFQEKELPIKYVAFSPCFRREAGSHGIRDKGLKRVHQFHKIELFCICTPEQSEFLHQEMIKQVTDLIESFGCLEYRKIELSKEDRSPISNKTIDIELKVNDEWLEVSSISNTGENQSKPGLIRFKSIKGKNIKCHLLNGSGVALPRLMLALEHHKDKWSKM